LKICYFGTYDKNRPRNRIIIDGLKKNGIDVLECHYSVWKGIEDKSQVNSLWAKIKICFNFIIAYPVLIAKYLNIGKHEALVVGYLGHLDMFIAKPLAIFRRKPLCFDAFLSLYDTVVFDRKLISLRNPLAKLLYYLDKIACQLADKIFLDTQAQINYFVDTFGSKRNKFYRVFVGAEENVFYPAEEDAVGKSDQSSFSILFYGQFVPLQGVEYIVKTVKLLAGEKSLKFTIIGKGQEYARIRKMANVFGLKNITWIDWVRYEELPGYINATDIALGIFGDTQKASRVIPNKAFQVIASGKPLITGDSPASRELFTDGEDAILCEMASSESIAEAIIQLKRDEILRKKISKQGYKIFSAKCTPKVIAQELLNCLPESPLLRSRYNFK